MIVSLPCLAKLERAPCRLLLPDNHLEERGLADAVRADHADNAIPGKAEGEIVDQHTVAEGLREVRGLEDLGAEARACRDMDLREVDGADVLGLCLHLLVGSKTCLALGLSGLRAGAHPLELALHLLGALRVLLAFHLEAGCLRLEVGRVVALVGIERATVDLADPLGDIVQEVAVMRDGEDCSWIVLEVLLEPEDRLGIEVVCRLVEKQQVRYLEKEPAEGDTPPLAAGEMRDRLVWIGALEGIHSLRELAFEVPAIRRVDLVLEASHLGHQRIEVGIRRRHLLADLVEAVDLSEQVAVCHLDVLDHGLVFVERRLLLKKSHRIARRQARLAGRHVLEPCHDLQERGLAHAIRADDADLGAREESHRHVVQDDLALECLAGLMHLVDELCHRTITSFRF